jgi:hypothetical protein
MYKKIHLWDLLGNLTDERDKWGRRYSLRSIVSLVLTGFLCGHNSIISISRFGRSLSKAKRRSLGFHKDMPCHATIGNVLKRVNMVEVENALGAFVMGSFGLEEGEVVAMDGKRLRGSKKVGEKPGVHLLSLFSNKLEGVISQVQMQEGTNEIVAAMNLLKSTSIKGLTITGDAIFTQTEICKKILAEGGNYFFTAKDNQKELKSDIKACFMNNFSPMGGEKLSAA